MDSGKQSNNSYIPPSITHFLNHLSSIRDVSQRLSELNAYLSNLEQEIRKLDAMKRNPQCCMLLLNDAVEFLKKEGAKMRREVESVQPKWPVMEFLPLKRSFSGGGGREDNVLTMMNCHCEKRHKSAINAVPETCKLISIGGGGGGAFTPFKATMPKITEPAAAAAAAAEESVVLSLLPPGTSSAGNMDADHNHNHNQQQPTIWKNNRRCWSPELHARFMAAMDFLGGPEVATPKQIRAIMQVEGLTNDQVKSHLQKYRLHNRGQHGSEEERGPAKPWKAESYSENSWS